MQHRYQNSFVRNKIHQRKTPCLVSIEFRVGGRSNYRSNRDADTATFVFFRYQKFDENMFVKIVCWGMSEEKKEPMSFSMR